MLEPDDTYAQIEAFWEWFVHHEPLIREVVADPHSLHRETVVAGMDNHVLSLGLFTWEIGHGQEESYSLIVSPNGDPDRLTLSRKLMYGAPKLRGWELHAAKPPRPDALLLNVYDDTMHLHEIDASGWLCIIDSFPNGLFEISVAAANVNHLDDETKLTAADLAVIAAIGEELKIRHLAAIELCHAFDSASEARAYPITALHRHIGNLLAQH